MGGFFNKLTSPLGVKLFPGGPYDPMQTATDKARKQYEPISNAGAQFVNQAATQIPDYMNKLLAMEFGTRDLSGGYAFNPNNVGQRGPGPGPQFQGTYANQFNALKEQIERQRAQHLSQLRAKMGASGMIGSSRAATHEGYLNSLYDKQIADMERNVLNLQKTGQQDALRQYLAMLQNNANMGAGWAGHGAGLTTAVGQAQENAQQQGIGNIAEFLQMLGGGGFGGGVPWRIGKAGPQPGVEDIMMVGNQGVRPYGWVEDPAQSTLNTYNDFLGNEPGL